MTSVAEHVAKEIISAIDKDELVLPTMPEMALKVREVAEDPDAGIADINAVISNDAALTARIIKVANSPLFRGAREIEDLSMALSRLGMQTTANLATGLAMEQMFQATSDIIDKRMRDVWARSSEIAGICHVLCRHYTKLRPDQATLAGLVSKIGVLPILSFAEDNNELLGNSMTLDSVIDEIHPAIGKKILTTWEFPTELRSVPVDVWNFERDAPKADYADLVTIATIQSYQGTPKFASLDLTTVKSFERLGLDPDIESAEAEDLSAEMEAAMAMLK